MANGNGNVAAANKLSVADNKKIATFLRDAAGLTESEQKTIIGDRQLAVKTVYMADRFNRDVKELVRLAHNINPKLRLVTYLCFGCYKKYNVDEEAKPVCTHCGHENPQQ